jgi:adenylate kinase family enzyme
MKKIAIIGCSGSGKSTLSIKLNEIFEIPVYHLDTLYWKPNWVETPRDEWDELQKELVKKETWIIDGNYNRTLKIRTDEADTIIMLDMPRRLCIYRVIKRFFKYRNSSRLDMNEGCREKLDLPFLKWVWSYNTNNRPKVIEILNKNKDKEIVILKKTKDVRNFINKLTK